MVVFDLNAAIGSLKCTSNSSRFFGTAVADGVVWLDAAQVVCDVEINLEQANWLALFFNTFNFVLTLTQLDTYIWRENKRNAMVNFLGRLLFNWLDREKSFFFNFNFLGNLAFPNFTITEQTDNRWY